MPILAFGRQADVRLDGFCQMCREGVVQRQFGQDQAERYEEGTIRFRGSAGHPTAGRRLQSPKEQKRHWKSATEVASSISQRATNPKPQTPPQGIVPKQRSERSRHRSEGVSEELSVSTCVALDHEHVEELAGLPGRRRPAAGPMRRLRRGRIADPARCIGQRTRWPGYYRGR